MHKTLKDFVGAKLVDETDKLAQRALKAFGRCGGPTGLIANANARGDIDAYLMVSRAHFEASAAFVLINQTKNYPFAEEVLAHMAVSIEAEQPAAAAAYLVGNAEGIIEAFAHRCAPVCTISGVTSVYILRGEHAAFAMRDVVAANAA
jgi:hypothetical protein